MTASGKAIYIGQSAESDHNAASCRWHPYSNRSLYRLHGRQRRQYPANRHHCDFRRDNHAPRAGEYTLLEGNYTNTAALFARLGPALLQVWDGELNLWTSVTAQNAADLITVGFSDGNTAIQAIHAVPRAHHFVLSLPYP